MDLPIYLLDVSDEISDETEVNYVAMVDKPAIKLNWQKFKDTPQRFAADAEKQVVSGPLMIADMPIYRNSEEFGEH